MSSSMVTYTSVYSDSKTWRFQWVSDVEPQSPEVAPQSPEQAPPSPDYVPGPEHPSSPDCVPGPEYSEYLVPSDDEDPIDYPTDKRDDEEEEESSEDDNDEEDEDEEDKHLAPADSVVLPAIDPFAFAPTPPSPPPSPLSPWSSLLPQISSPPLPLPLPPTHTSPTYADAPLGYITTLIQSRATSPPPVPSPPLLLPSADRKSDIPETNMPFRKRLCLTAPDSRFEVRESSTAVAARQTGHTLARRVDYIFINTMDASIRASESRVMSTMEEVNERVTDLATTEGQDVHELYAWSRSEDWSTTLKASDIVTSAFRRIHALEARDRACPDDLENTGSRVTDALAEHETNRNSRNGDDSHDSGNGGRRQVPTTRECTYSDFLKCQPLNFKGTEGVVGLTQWFEKMESVFHISNYTVACQIKFATCTLLGSALTWWNSHVKTVGHDAAYGMP
ncbi:hypothetical protein Tco_0482620 [Tanacetum coccineum]